MRMSSLHSLNDQNCPDQTNIVSTAVALSSICELIECPWQQNNKNK